ncbi:MAG: fused MFS/spermidine synthase [Gammaproteobacteria bacterium]|nr:fused MFS/spermidine synthase [Gammaproteobacteria bacterium]
MRLTRAMLVLALTVCAAPALSDVIYTEKSLYRNISATDEGDRVCMLFTAKGRFESMQSCMFKHDHDLLVFDYARMAFAGLLVNPNPKSVLIAGLGGGSIPRVFREVFPDTQVDVIEIDPAVVRVAEEYFDFQAGANINVVVQDARVYIKRALKQNKKYDYIILDAYNGEYIPEHLMTKEFLEECRELLTDNGVLIANTFSLSRLYHSESVTYEEAFGWLVNVKQKSGNRIVLTRKGEKLTADELFAAARKDKRQFQRFGINLRLLAMLAKFEPDWNQDARVLTDQYSPANLLNGPR